GHFGVFSLTGWSRQIHAGFLVSRITRVPERILKIFAYATITLYGWLFHTPSANLLDPLYLVPRPRWSKPHRFRLLRFRSPLLTESLLFSFPRGTEMVHFPRLALSALCIQAVVYRVPPFGHRRVNG